jgi:hypothetical protein
MAGGTLSASQDHGLPSHLGIHSKEVVGRGEVPILKVLGADRRRMAGVQADFQLR